MLSALICGEFKRFHDSIYRNLRELSLFISYVITNSSLNRLGFGNSYILTVLIALVDLIVPVSTDSCLYVVEYCLESAKKVSEGKIHKSKPEPRNGKLRKYCPLHSSEETLESVARSLFTIHEHAIANVCLYLCFQLRIMYVKKICIYILLGLLRYENI